jgi:hypothetical protein
MERKLGEKPFPQGGGDKRRVNPALKGEETRKKVIPSNRRRRKRKIIFRKDIIKNL